MIDLYLKVTAGVLVTAILCLFLSKHGADISILLTLGACCMVIGAAVSALAPVLQFVARLVDVGRLDHDLLDVFLKVIGIGLISQFAGLICTDAGNQSLSKVLQLMTTAVILCLAIPILEELLSLLESLLGEI